jgi:hypothetical protein
MEVTMPLILAENAKIHGIETGSASLEELYKLVVGANKSV